MQFQSRPPAMRMSGTFAPRTRASSWAYTDSASARVPELRQTRILPHGNSMQMSTCRRSKVPPLRCAVKAPENAGSGCGAGSILGVRLGPTLAALFAVGFIAGPPLDGFHTNVGLLEYDQLPVTIGSWKTSLADPLLLGTYYAVAGGLLLALDRFWASSLQQRQRSAQRSSPAWLALGFGLLAAFLQLSSVMYDIGTPYSQIWAALAVTGLLGWRLLDGSKQTLLLALVSAAVCPVAELALMHIAGLWHYPHADVHGITSWVACCYAFYSVIVGILARGIAAKFSDD